MHQLVVHSFRSVQILSKKKRHMTDPCLRMDHDIWINFCKQIYIRNESEILVFNGPLPEKAFRFHAL